MELTPGTATEATESSAVTTIVATMLVKFGSDALRVAEAQMELATGTALTRWAVIAEQLRRLSARP